MKEFDDLCAKNIRAKCQKISTEATSNDDENNVETTMDVDNNEIPDDPTNTETSAHSNNKVNSKRGGDSRRKYNKNKEGRYACEYCDKSYTQTGNLKLHINKVHGTAV